MQASHPSRGLPGYEGLLEHNWNGNVRFGGTPIVPASVDELRDVVRSAVPPIRVVGRGHSFTPLAECGGGTLLSLCRLNRILDFSPPSGDGSVGSITIEGGATYTEVAAFLGRRGALRNLPSCPQFTVAGAIATGTHGSGVHHRSLAADVSMIEFVSADGSLRRYSRKDSPELLGGCLVHLGCLGAVSRLALDVVPWYEVRSFRYDDAPLDRVIEALPQLWASCDSLSVWTSGFGVGPGAGTCWMTLRHFAPHWDAAVGVPEHRPPPFLGGGDSGAKELPATTTRPLPRYCAPSDAPHDFIATGVLPWHDALTLTLRGGVETSMPTVDIQAEFFVPLARAREAVQAVWALTREWTFSAPWGYRAAAADDETATTAPPRGLVDAFELRQVRGGGGRDGWLSPQAADSLGIHVSFNGDPARRAAVEAAVAKLDRALEPFGARVHWGKLLAPRLAKDPEAVERLYGSDKLGNFRTLCHAHDPHGRFRNRFVTEMLFGAPTPPPPSESPLESQQGERPPPAGRPRAKL
jgi:xylitol oxidase